MEGVSKENASSKDDSAAAATGSVSAAAATKGVSNEAALNNDFENAPTPDDSNEGLPSLQAGSQVVPDPSTSPRPWFQVPVSCIHRGRK